MTYEERINLIAEEMAKLYCTSEDVSHHYIQRCKPLAAIALKHMAEAYAEGCGTILLDKDEIQRNLFLIGYEPQTT